MTPYILEPSLNFLRQEYVLVQAWKKTSEYIRYHNWYSDTLELDWVTVNLAEFIAGVASRLDSPEQWNSDKLRLVPAPKRQKWQVSKNSVWRPEEKDDIGARIRPLAYVSIQDQVVATALMLCLANRVETIQGDTRVSVYNSESRKNVSSYGNRLFCDKISGELHHRWGSSKLYRAYSQDYQSFISRPQVVAEQTKLADGQSVFIVESDLKQFYDRVRPTHLAQALRSIETHRGESAFFDFAIKVLDWQWHSHDEKDVATYAKQAGLDDFTRVTLPQGLVSAGFFANLVLLTFDDSLRRKIGHEIAKGIRLDDTCRYVDDLRIVVTTDQTVDECELAIFKWLEHLLSNKVSGLIPSREKTKAAEFRGSERSLIRQSVGMERIQSMVSGGFDAIGGMEILDAIQGLMRSQEALSGESAGDGWQFSPIPDVRDETVARFSATRFRTTYRSIRPLLEDVSLDDEVEKATIDFKHTGSIKITLGRQELDEKARAFALLLITRWVKDPSNIRLLRIGLDIWPDVNVLREILKLLRPFTEMSRHRNAPEQIAWYCLSELLRAGATETGHVEEDEHLPTDIDIQQYREVLREEAIRLIKLTTIPWYLQQQALLYIAVFDPKAAPVFRTGQNVETRRYHQLIRFLKGDIFHLTSSKFATLAVLSRRSFTNADNSVQLAKQRLTASRKKEIANRDPKFICELGGVDNEFFKDLPPRIRKDLCITVGSGEDQSLAEIVLNGEPTNSLRNELSLLRFAAKLLENLQKFQFEVITPGQVRLKLNDDGQIANIKDMKVSRSRIKPDGSLYSIPSWCEPSDRWQLQLGYLLRFILTRQPDFTSIIRPEHWKERSGTYRPAKSHWYQRLYGLFNAQSAFGDDWLPISDWMEKLLLALLRWPGVQAPHDFEWVEDGMKAAQQKIEKRIERLESIRGPSTGTLLMPIVMSPPTDNGFTRTLRACVVQTVVPSAESFDVNDLTLTQPSIRRTHRNHLSAALAAVNRMLDLRRTHMQDDGRLDWLILPELAVHPLDVKTHLFPFARAHKALILAGLTYEELFQNKPLVNSALWIIPERSGANGLQLRVHRQGKLHLAPDEEMFNNSSARLQGFRPCQWLVGYPWSDDCEPVWLTASVCYDATDLALVADLRKESDIFAIPALNKDVKTFDQMALALHYHMFQLVVVANNGQYGGSNAYWPIDDTHRRQIFHLHGQPQASIAFFEIDDIENFLARQKNTVEKLPKHSPDGWKHPPAGFNDT